MKRSIVEERFRLANVVCHGDPFVGDQQQEQQEANPVCFVCMHDGVLKCLGDESQAGRTGRGIKHSDRALLEGGGAYVNASTPERTSSASCARDAANMHAWTQSYDTVHAYISMYAAPFFFMFY